LLRVISQVCGHCSLLSVTLLSAFSLTHSLKGVFDHTPLIVKEPTGEFRPENEWTRGGPGSDNADDHHAPGEGSGETELPMNQLSELFNVNHFIVSQVRSSVGLSCSSDLNDC
jgi:TAG lipase / steryl ester hydrolase / phospholipase A2 / LPA acyltransferase